MTEALHRDLQPLRRNAFDVVARLHEASVFFALNHLLHFYERRVALDAYLRLLDVVPALEVRNGTMLPAHNRLSEQIAAARVVERDGARLAAVAGSDAHTLRRVGTTWTEAPGCNREEFLSSVRAGLGRPGGRDGGTLAVTGDAYGVIGRFIASLLGFPPRDHGGWRRAACLGFVVGSVPFQLAPLVIASRGKLREHRKVGALANWMVTELGGEGPAPSVRAARAER
jgi:hypothetical protein